jgi:hypothetical protein
MHIRIGCVDGNTYSSDEISRAEMQAELDSVDGYIGTGDLANKRFSSVDEAMEWMLDCCKYDSRNDTQTINMTINANTRTFNARHIVWWEVVG